VAAPTYPDVLSYFHDQQTTAPTVADLRRAVLAIRRSKGMVLDDADPDTRSVGSFFMNPVVAVTDRERIAAQAGMPPSFAVDDGHVSHPDLILHDQEEPRDHVPHQRLRSETDRQADDARAGQDRSGVDPEFAERHQTRDHRDHD